MVRDGSYMEFQKSDYKSPSLLAVAISSLSPHERAIDELSDKFPSQETSLETTRQVACITQWRTSLQ